MARDVTITMITDTPVPRRVGDVYSLDEARRYEEIAKEFVNSCTFVLNSFGERLPDIGEVEPPQDLENEAQRAQYIGDLYQHAAQWERISKNLTQRVTTELARASSIPPPATQNRRKFPQPGKYEGGLGDPAITFITQCQNYLATEGTTWPDQYRVPWALQFLEGKAGPWAELQLRRMEEEKDELGDPPSELINWKSFMEHFKTQWYDSGSIINARKRWKKGFTQTGSAKEYFAIVEQLVVKLNYNKDSAEVIDIAFEGLKQHIRTHFALQDWPDFKTLKESCVVYDEAYFAQNRRTETRDFKQKGKKPQKTETVAMGSASGSGSKRLSDEDWELCKVKGLCFVCKKIGKDVLGLAKEHPNHPPKEGRKAGGSTKTVDNKKPQKKKSASVRATDLEQELGSDVDRNGPGDSDSEDQPEGSKN